MPSRRGTLVAAGLAAGGALGAGATNPAPGPDPSAPFCCTGSAPFSLFQGPGVSRQDPVLWRQHLLQWRNDTIAKFKLTFPSYDNPRLNWTRLTQVQPQVHPWDRYLWDEKRHEFTVNRYLEDLRARYGGIDSVLIWPTYPTIGIDARNQFDLWRAFPGGLDGAAELVRQFHEAGVRVLFPFNPFDQGLRDEGEPNWVTLVKLLKQIGADGFNGDTMYTTPKEIFQAGLDLDYPIVGEMEDGGYENPHGWDFDAGWASADWDTLGWGYYFSGSVDGITSTFWDEPGVDKAKWLDPRGRRQTHVCDRWAKDRHDSLQFAHFNGVGYTSWENVWGIFMTFTERDGEALRRLSNMWRWLRGAEFLQNFADWHPFAAEVSSQDLYASRWIHANGTCAWTVVNRASEPRTFDLNHEGTPCVGERLFDLYSGQEVTAQGRTIEGQGYGAYLLTSGEWTPTGLEELLATMRGLAQKSLSEFSTNWAPLQQQLVTQSDAVRPASSQPEGTVLVPRATFRFVTGGVEVEGGCDSRKDVAGTGICCSTGLTCPNDGAKCYEMCGFSAADDRGVDFQFPWESTPRRFHDQVLDVGPFYIDKYPVTNAQFAEYLAASGYKPRDPYNFLRNWENATHFRVGDDRKPVTWVSLDEARDYCAWAGKRLPHAWEWQLAAQGTDRRTYPWGNTADSSRYPTPEHGRQVPPLPDVGSFPQGDSPYNVSDLVGLVWQFTDAFEDPHTRAVLLKGSSIYNPVLGGDFPAVPQVGNWYFPMARKLTLHNKLMLWDESYDRAETVGFRCVADHPEGAPAPLHLHSHAATEEPIITF